MGSTTDNFRRYFGDCMHRCLGMELQQRPNTQGQLILPSVFPISCTREFSSSLWETFGFILAILWGVFWNNRTLWYAFLRWLIIMRIHFSLDICSWEVPVHSLHCMCISVFCSTSSCILIQALQSGRGTMIAVFASRFNLQGFQVKPHSPTTGGKDWCITESSARASLLINWTGGRNWM